MQKFLPAKWLPAKKLSQIFAKRVKIRLSFLAGSHFAGKNFCKKSYNEKCSLKPKEHFSKKVLPDKILALFSLKKSQKFSKKAKFGKTLDRSQGTFSQILAFFENFWLFFLSADPLPG